MFVMVLPLLINPGNANLGGKVAFVFFGTAFFSSIWLWFYFPEMKGRSYLELEEMFQNKVPARKFKSYQCEVQVVEVLGDEKPAVFIRE